VGAIAAVGSQGELLSSLRQRLAATSPTQVDKPGLCRAAVLVPLLFKAGEAHLLFTQRSEKVATHKGHVSFPGGVIEPEDEGALAAALRETQEEIGVPRHKVEVLGQMDDVATSSVAFGITPFAAAIPAGVAHVTSADEVARILEVPLVYLLNPATREPDAATGHWRYPWQDAVIWGATARILTGFLAILGLADPRDKPSSQLGSHA